MKLLVAVSLLLLVFGCGGSNDNTAVPAGSGSESNIPVTDEAGEKAQIPSPTPKDGAAELKADFEGTIGIIDKKYEIKEVAMLSAVRTGRHDGFDRIVFEFKGPDLPGYHIEYIDKPVRACGSGDVVPLAGDGWLQMRFEPARAHTDEGKATIGFRELASKHPNLLEIKSTCDFEAQVEWVAGVGSPNAFRVLELKEPTRLAVDIKHK
jgi:hypothetical protein